MARNTLTSTTVNPVSASPSNVPATIYGPIQRATPIHKYPENLIKDYVDYLNIDTFKYTNLTDYYTRNNVAFNPTAPTTATPPTPTPVTGNTPATPTTTPTAAPSVLRGYVAGDNYDGRGVANERFVRGATVDTFQLPIPDSIQIDDSPIWNLEDLKTMGKFVPTLGGQFNSNNMSGAADTLKNLTTNAMPEMVLGVVEQTGFMSSKEAITQGFGGKILNPYYEMIFKGIQPRSFSCRYKLVPRNQKEQFAIANIIKNLRVNSLPNYSAQGVSDNTSANTFQGLGDRWLTTPNIFYLRFLTSNALEIPYLPKLKPMVCTSISTNYTPDGSWATHVDGAPQAIDLSLRFNEVEIITSREVEKYGY